MHYIEFPTDIELVRNGKTIIDFMDKDFIDCWNYYIIDGETDIDQNNNKRSKEKYLSEYN